MRKVVLDEWSALGGPAPYSLVGVDDAFEWNGDRKGPRIGTYYTVLRQIDVEKVRVLVRDAAPVVDPITFQNLTLSQFPKVNFEQLTAMVSVNSRTGSLAIYAEAAAIKLAAPAK